MALPIEGRKINVLAMDEAKLLETLRVCREIKEQPDKFPAWFLIYCEFLARRTRAELRNRKLTQYPIT